MCAVRARQLEGLVVACVPVLVFGVSSATSSFGGAFSSSRENDFLPVGGVPTSSSKSLLCRLVVSGLFGGGADELDFLLKNLLIPC